MPTNSSIDDRLIEEAQKVGRHRTKKEAVEPPRWMNTFEGESSWTSSECSEKSITTRIMITSSSASENPNGDDGPCRYARLVIGISP